MLRIEVDDKQIQQFIKNSPERAGWALKESFGKAGGHYRKRLKDAMTRGDFALTALSGMTTRGRTESRPPLAMLNRLIFFKVRKIKRTFQELSLGYMAGAKGLSGKIFWGKFTITQMAKMHEYGQRRRVTEKMRDQFARMGYPLKETTKLVTIPPRPVIQLFWQRYKTEIPKYIEDAFFEIFFSSRNPRLKI